MYNYRPELGNPEHGPVWEQFSFQKYREMSLLISIFKILYSFNMHQNLLSKSIFKNKAFNTFEILYMLHLLYVRYISKQATSYVVICTKKILSSPNKPITCWVATNLIWEDLLSSINA